MEYPQSVWECARCRWEAPPPGKAGGRFRSLCDEHRELVLNEPGRDLAFTCTPLADFLPRRANNESDPRERAVMDAPVNPPRPAHPSRAKPSRGLSPQGLDIGE